MRLLICFIAVAFVAFGQGPVTGSSKATFTLMKTNIMKAAEKMPETSYSFKPTPEVRSFGEIVGHVADAQYLFCSAVLGEKPEMKNVEKTAKTKADLTEALKVAFGYCDKAYDSMDDAKMAGAVKFFGRDSTRVGVLDFNTAHNAEHYGNLVTYMRIRGMVPPSSEGR